MLMLWTLLPPSLQSSKPADIRDRGVLTTYAYSLYLACRAFSQTLSGKPCHGFGIEIIVFRSPFLDSANSLHCPRGLICIMCSLVPSGPYFVL